MSEDRRKRNLTALPAVFVMLLGVIFAGACASGSQGGSDSGSQNANLDCPNDFPSERITFITWSDPGGGGDVLGRAMIEAINSQNLVDVPIVIENRAGGSGAAAMSRVVEQPADGHTVLIVTKNLTLTPLTQEMDTSYEDFKPIQRSQLEPFFVAVGGDSPWENIEDVAKAAQSEEVNFGGAFAGSTDNLLFAQLGKEAGFDLTYVPFDSGGEAATGVVNGDVDVISTAPQEVSALVDSGDLKFIATPTEERLPGYPDLPTFKDQDYDIVLEQWRGFVYNKDVSDELVTCMDSILKEASKDEGFKDYMKNGGLADGYLPSDKFQQAIEQETAENRKFLKEEGLLVE